MNLGSNLSTPEELRKSVTESVFRQVSKFLTLLVFKKNSSLTTVIPSNSAFYVKGNIYLDQRKLLAPLTKTILVIITLFQYLNNNIED